MEIDELVRSHRKTVGLIVTTDARLVVRAPLRMPLKQILELVNSKTAWIEAKKIQMQQSLYSSLKRQIGIQQEQEILFLGKPHTILWSDLQEKDLEIHRNSILISNSRRENAFALLRNWYKQQAHLIIPERVATQSENTGMKGYISVRITSARTRWGSCSAKGNLSFSWRLVMAPIEVIDYVIIHELTYLHIRNHSKEFWELMRTYDPSYKEHKSWLKQNGPLLPI
jgi:hypothetical protein